MNGITSAARAAELRRQMEDDSSDSDLGDSPPAKKRVRSWK